ncbi:helix-turn-helix transcriptional regulator [Streptomyces sp. 71268]|uniref:helix-turn-helix domain-containing protein n=1 Tax=Streptomyces sp. 71268 TaxID=3002640 RepID=UPI0023FA047D|nr:helix-turn-helix transcriptional regulator [Streptomyces sp. 71268]WEV25599.1 helix-turn-helix transcriptional regulator [Streptomyces sp. 71268]
MGLRSNPSYRQRRFGAEVRKLRERAGLSVTEAAELVGTRQSHLSNAEAGRTSLSQERLRRLADTVTGIGDTYIEALVELDQGAGGGWWDSYRNRVRSSLLDIADLESRAERLLIYEPMFIPVHLQTAAYATAGFRGGYARVSPQEQDLDIEFRMRRRQVMESGTPAYFHAVIHEAALHATFGDRSIMREQLAFLIEGSRRPNVTIQILPFDGPVAFGTGFTLAVPAEAELSTVVVGHVEKSLYLGDSDSLSRYNQWFASLSDRALPPVDASVQPEAHRVKDSLGLIQRILYSLL